MFTKLQKWDDLMADDYRTQMRGALCQWLKDIAGNYPDWRDSNRKRIQRTLHFDSINPDLIGEEEPDFIFPSEVEKQRAVALGYLKLHLTIEALKKCEFYFRRYPFRGLPVTRSEHISNICEMYFSRFYQFKANLKTYFRAIKNLMSTHASGTMTEDAVEFFAKLSIKAYEKRFEQELRARNLVHHHERFEDIEISRIALKEITYGEISTTAGQRRIQSEEYREAIKFWVKHVRNSGVEMDALLEQIAAFTLEDCQFLSDVRKN